MATAQELTTTVATLDERVKNHIKFFWAVVAALCVWLGYITTSLFSIKTNVHNVAVAQANAPITLAVSLLDRPSSSRQQTAESLSAVSAILSSTKKSDLKPDPRSVSKLVSAISDTQRNYADLPQTWQATAQLISYKSKVQVGQSPQVRCSSAFGGAGWRFTNCEVTLEDLAVNTANNYVDGVLAPYTFVNCTVHYHGGQAPTTRMSFYNSRLDVDVDSIPQPQGQRFLQELTKVDMAEPIQIRFG